MRRMWARAWTSAAGAAGALGGAEGAGGGMALVEAFGAGAGMDGAEPPLTMAIGAIFAITLAETPAFDKSSTEE